MFPWLDKWHTRNGNYENSGRIPVKFLNNYSSNFLTQTMKTVSYWIICYKLIYIIISSWTLFAYRTFLTIYLNSHSVSSTFGYCYTMIFLYHKNNRPTISFPCFIYPEGELYATCSLIRSFIVPVGRRCCLVSCKSQSWDSLHQDPVGGCVFTLMRLSSSKRSGYTIRCNMQKVAIFRLLSTVLKSQVSDTQGWLRL